MTSIVQRTAAQRILVGPLAELLDESAPAGPVLVVGSRRSVGLADWAALGQRVEVFDGAAAHNPASVVAAAAERARSLAAATVVAVGGAAAIDLGKAVADRSPAASVAVPTTLGGSEMSRVYGSRHPDGVKRGGGGAKLLPGTVCYDPSLLASLPTDVLLASGVNALAHAVEAHYARRPHWIGTACAAQAGRDLPGLLRRAAAERTGEVHARLFESACLAGFALNTRGMGLHHAICHVLGGLTGVSHAALNLAVLPAAVATNARLAPGAVSETLAALGLADLDGTLQELASAAGVPSTLRDLGLRRADLDAALPQVMAAHHLANNPRPPDEADVAATLAAAYDGAGAP
ncbi:iron-containing alcohol dehydrogenase [Actinomadura sp. 1N219]|uniref:iron-containing alcohol dehydrogenase n=1 Tax=Actinomadura sp. 1N219 TaxID=3375152 RepID=UPI0037A52385